MFFAPESPLLILLIALGVQILCLYLGNVIRMSFRTLSEEERSALPVVQSASLGLLALIIGFTFSMAGARYEQRRALEQLEANAIETSYVRTDLFADGDATPLRSLLRDYLDRRVAFYATRDSTRLKQISLDTQRFETSLWSKAVAAANQRPTPLASLALTSINQIFDTRGNAEAALENRIPLGAWALMGMTAMACCITLGYGQRSMDLGILLVLPVTVSIALYIVADLDSPRGGLIAEPPRNLEKLSISLQPAMTQR